MYKIMTKLHTKAENVYAFHMVTNDMGEKVEYAVTDPAEAQKEALDILKRVGYEDLRILDDKSYYLTLEYGERPVDPEVTHTITIIAPEGCTVNPASIEDIAMNASVNTGVTFDNLVPSFHLIVDEVETTEGMPEWISFKTLSATTGILYFTGVTVDHLIEIVIDND